MARAGAAAPPPWRRRRRRRWRGGGGGALRRGCHRRLLEDGRRLELEHPVVTVSRPCFERKGPSARRGGGARWARRRAGRAGGGRGGAGRGGVRGRRGWRGAHVGDRPGAADERRRARAIATLPPSSSAPPLPWSPPSAAARGTCARAPCGAATRRSHHREEDGQRRPPRLAPPPIRPQLDREAGHRAPTGAARRRHLGDRARGRAAGEEAPAERGPRVVLDVERRRLRPLAATSSTKWWRRALPCGSSVKSSCRRARVRHRHLKPQRALGRHLRRLLLAREALGEVAQPPLVPRRHRVPLVGAFITTIIGREPRPHVEAAGAREAHRAQQHEHALEPSPPPPPRERERGVNDERERSRVAPTSSEGSA